MMGSVRSSSSPWRPLPTPVMKTGCGDVVAQVRLGEIGPAPHLHFSSEEKLASWVTLCPGNNISARMGKHGRSRDAGTCIKPMLIQAAWAAIRSGAGCRPGTAGWSPVRRR
jgi:transposase